MKFRLKAAIAAFGLGAVVAAGCALAQSDTPAPPAPAKPKSPGGRACFYADQIRGYSAPKSDLIYVQANGRDIYEVDAGGCRDVDLSLRIGLESRSGPWICAGDLVDLVVPQGPGGPDRCLARVTHKLTADEIKAIPRKDLPY